MHLKYRLSFAIIATAAIALGRLHAQADDEEDEEFTTMGFFGKSPQELNVALKLTKGPQVKFGNLGNLPTTYTLPAAGQIGRSYMDGYVRADARRLYDANAKRSEYAPKAEGGDALSTVNGRYQSYDSNNNLVGDYLAYREGYTRNWGYSNQSQAETNPGFIAMNIYSAHSQGASMMGSRGYSGGVELSVARNLLTAKRFTFSIVAGLSLNGINSSKSGEVNSTLHTFRDLYALDGLAPYTPLPTTGTAPSVRYTGPSFITGTDGVEREWTGIPHADGVQDTTLTISDLPTSSDDSDTHDQVNGALVKGIWKLRGAYFTLRVGPQVTAMITKKIGLTAGFGLAGSYVGTTYSADESFTVSGITDPSTGEPQPITNVFGEESTTKNTLLAGYYANIDATWDLNERTGLFAGVSMDNLGSYDQSVGGRTAKIDLNSTAGVRGGLSIKF